MRWRRRMTGTLAAIGVLAFSISAAAGAESARAAAPATTLQGAWQAVADSPGLAHATISAYAYDLTAHEPLAALNPQQLQIPASVTKLFTSAAALDALGPNYEFSTRVEASPAVLAGSPGPVYLVGGGDPWLEANGTHGLETLAAAVAKKVARATQVIGVSSLYAGPAIGQGWSLDELEYSYSAPVAALSAERSEIEVVARGTTAGKPVQVSLSYNGAVHAPGFFQIKDEATTVAKGAGGATITRLPGTETIVVQGSMLPGRVAADYLSVGDPALFAAALFQQALAQDGVHFSAQAATGAAPQGLSAVASQASRPLSYLLQMQNRFSINSMADILFRTLGTLAGGDGSAAAAEAQMAAFDARAGVGARTQVDGSGLSPLDLTSAQQVVALLRYAASRPWYEAFKTSMMEAGNPDTKVCGVICGHFAGTAAVDKVWLKTGNLDNQWNYAGYATAADGHTIAFAILVEGPLAQQMSYYGAALSPIDQMTVDLARWPNLSGAAQGRPPAEAGVPSFLAPLLAGLPGNSSAVTGGAAIDLATGRLVWQEQGGALIRAGWLPRLGLVSAALAGKAKSFAGAALRAGGAVAGGVVHGPLVLDGRDDPGITAAGLVELAQAVAAAGVHAVTGPVEYVVGPPSPSGVRWPTNAPDDALGQAYLPPASRLIAAGESVTVEAVAGVVGSAPQLATAPADAPVQIENEAVTGPAGTPATLAATLDPTGSGYVVTGSVPSGGSAEVEVAPPAAGELAATGLRDALEAAGVSVGKAGVLGVARPASGALLASLPGTAVASLAAGALFGPSTEDASQLLLLLGSGAQKGVAAQLGTTDILPDPTGFALNDYMTPESVAAVLARARSQSAEQPLVKALGSGLWHVAAPGTYAEVGYVTVQGVPYAVVLMQSGLPFTGSWAPQISPPGQ